MTPTPRRILLIRPSALGDVCRSVPVLVSLRRAMPGARIDWLVQSGFADAVRCHPALSGVVAFDRRELLRPFSRSSWSSTRAWLSMLRGAKYDLVIDAQGLARSGIMAWSTRAPVRVGHAQARELAWLGYTRRVPEPHSEHTVDRMLSLLDAIDVPPVHDMRLYAPPEELAQLDRDGALSAKRYALIAPTSRWRGKQWPAQRYAELIPALLDDPHLALDAAVLVGSSGERDQIAPLLELSRRDARVHDRLGTTSVGGLMALVSRCAVLIGSDSAAVHMGVGFDRPMAALYGPTDAARVGPYRRDDAVVQVLVPGDTFDHKHERHGRAMMERITAEMVLSKVREQMDHAAHPNAPD